ncbi:hypothetical protein BLNAU_18006 [Blattamonas nauphoetae]|uniref:Uncharacterized protein n=1 Tax=Blattamonas nauphoetae TaxID=2049346 RepID=A0ABQ9X660_9EUKA|nr:hypothetical protein BLNAU_18006 [Blattamonas nauphoetae]
MQSMSISPHLHAGVACAEIAKQTQNKRLAIRSDEEEDQGTADRIDSDPSAESYTHVQLSPYHVRGPNIRKSSEGECVRICESSIPSFLLDWMISISDDDMNTELGNCLVTLTSTPRSYSIFLAHHKTQFLAFLDHSESPESVNLQRMIIAQLCFSPHLEMSKVALKGLLTFNNSVSRTCSFLQTLSVPSDSTDSSSELVPFAGRLCGRLAEHVSEMKSLFAESSPSDGTISALSATLPAESPILTGNTVLDVLFEGFTLLDILVANSHPFERITLIEDDFVPLLNSTIIVCLDLLEQLKTESVCPPTRQIALLTKVLNDSWNCAASCLDDFRTSLHPVVESAFSDVPQLCSLLERTCYHSSPTRNSHLEMIIFSAANLPHLIPRLLEENLIERMFVTTRPMAVPTTHCDFHVRHILVILNMIRNPKVITEDNEARKRIRKLQFEHALKPAKQYLQFILQREEFLQKDDSSDNELTREIGLLLTRMLVLERDLLENGEIAETGREVWEVGWLVETTIEDDLRGRLKMIREDDMRMKMNEKSRWKKRVERQREAGHEDAMEEWLTRVDCRIRSEIVEYLKRGSSESGMNHRIWTGWR